MFIFARGRDRVWAVEGQKEETESEAVSRLPAVSTEPDAGVEHKNHEVTTQAEVPHWNNWVTQAPLMTFV